MFSSYTSSLNLKVYFGIIAIFVIISSVFIYLFTPTFAYAQMDSVKFFLSTLVESEATVIAIVISLSLVVIELTASSYSTRVIDIFKESTAIWTVIGTYIIAIIYGMTVLKFIDVIAALGTSIFETAVWIAYFLAILAFGALIPYLLSSLDIMKSSKVINRFAERINRENILSGVSESENIVGKSATSVNFSYLYPDILRPVIEIDKDPIQPIIDIVHGSLMKYDYETTRYGLKVLENYMIKFIQEDEFKKDDIIIAKHIFAHLERVGKLAASREDDDSVLEVITTLFMIGKTAITHEYENTAGEAVNAIKNIGRLVIKQEMEDLVLTITDLIADIGRDSVRKKLDFSTSVTINSLGIIGRAASKHAQQGVEETVGIAGTIHEIGKLAVKLELKQSVFFTVNSLGDMGKYTTKNNLPKTSIIIVNYLKDMVIDSLERDNNDNTNNIVEYLWEMGRIAVWNELNIIALRKLLKNIKNSLKDLKIKAHEKELTETVLVISLALERLEKLMNEQKLNDQLSNRN